MECIFCVLCVIFTLSLCSLLLKSIDCYDNWDTKVPGVLDLLLQVAAAFLHQIQVLDNHHIRSHLGQVYVRVIMSRYNISIKEMLLVINAKGNCSSDRYHHLFCVFLWKRDASCDLEKNINMSF